MPIGFSNSTDLIDRVKFGSAWKFGGAGWGAVIMFASATDMLTCKMQCFGTLMQNAEFLETVRLPKHPRPNHNGVHLREHPIPDHPGLSLNNARITSASKCQTALLHVLRPP